MRNRRTISLDLRERILDAYDEGKATREQVAQRFRVSLGMAKKLIQQRRHIGDIRARHHLAGRKPLILAEDQEKMGLLLKQKPDLSSKELREALGLKCSVQANLAPHKSDPTLRLIKKAGARVHFLPAYSPDFSPIEKMWSKVKALLRSAEARTPSSLSATPWPKSQPKTPSIGSSLVAIVFVEIL